MSQEITLYGHATCPGVPPTRAMLGRSKVPYRYVDIHRDPQAAERVRAINNGNESVPTLVFPDGSTLTEPTPSEVTHKLEAMGYKVGMVARLLGYGWQIVTAIVILYAVLRFLEII